MRTLTRYKGNPDIKGKRIWILCPQCNIVQEAYFEVWCCDKNPNGLTFTNTTHGNEIEGCETCEDDYCRPDAVVPCLPSSRKKAEEFIDSHEGALRCHECDIICDQSPPIWKVFPYTKHQERVPQE